MFRYQSAILFTLLLLLNVAFFSLLGDPHLLVLRDYETSLFVLVAVLSMLAAVFIQRRSLRLPVLLLLLALSALAIHGQYAFSRWKAQILANPSQAYQHINGRFIIGFRDKEEAWRLAENGIGGIFLTSRNIAGETFDSLQAFIQGLQARRAALGLTRLIVATDQEGGPVSRLSPLIQRQAPLASEYAAGNSLYDYGAEQGRALSRLGVTVNFSPVVDLKPDRPPSRWDFHSQIGSRAISARPQQVIQAAGDYIRGLESAGVTATLKHFPGLARIQEDTHHFSARLDTDRETLQRSDLLPFMQLASSTRSWLMLSHLIYTPIDAESPVSTSAKMIDGYIRSSLKISNTLVSDDLTMAATYNRGYCRSVREAYATSLDYLLVAYDYEKYYDAVMCLIDQSISH